MLWLSVPGVLTMEYMTQLWVLIKACYGFVVVAVVECSCGFNHGVYDTTVGFDKSLLWFCGGCEFVLVGCFFFVLCSVMI